MQKLLVAGLAIFTVGTAITPSFADTGNSQTSTNISTVDNSSGTTVRQSNTQSIRNRSRDRNDTANIQDALNDSLVQDSDDTRVNQSNRQRIRNRAR